MAMPGPQFEAVGRQAAGGGAADFREQQRTHLLVAGQVRNVVAAKIQQLDMRLDQVIQLLRLLQVVIEQMFQQDRLAVVEGQRQAFGRLEQKLRAVALEQTEVVIDETGGIQVRRVLDGERPENAVQIGVVNPRVGAAATIQTADLDVGACERPGAGVTEIRAMLRAFGFDPRVGQVGCGHAAAHPAMDRGIFDLRPGAFFAFDQRPQRAFGSHFFRLGMFKLVSLDLEVSPRRQARQAHMRRTFMRQWQPAFGIFESVVPLWIAVLGHAVRLSNRLANENMAPGRASRLCNFGFICQQRPSPSSSPPRGEENASPTGGSRVRETPLSCAAKAGPAAVCGDE